MEEVSEKRNLKIFCPQHQAVFEVEENSKIVCEIREHALSNNFPNEEFWEYFWSSDAPKILHSTFYILNNPLVNHRLCR